MSKPQLIQELESKAGITYVDNQDKMLVNRNLGDGLGYSDGRALTGDDLLPKYYFKTHRLNGLCVQLFDRPQLDSVGNQLPNGLYHVITTSPWHDTTGGVKQIAIGGNQGGQYVRYNTSDTLWTTWKSLATTEHTDIVYLNGWGNYVGVGRATKIGKLVTIAPIRIQNGLTDQATVLFTLPDGYKPAVLFDERVTVELGTTLDMHKTTNVRFYTNGNVQLLYADVPTGSKLQLPAISFYVN